MKLTQLEPQNPLHTNNYQQVVAKLGGGLSGSKLITAEEGAVLVEELEATAPFVDQRYGDEIALAVRAALTDAELFVSYNMPAKALGPLLSALPKAPQDLRLNQRLAALHTRAGRFARSRGLLPHIWKASTTMPDIPRKQPVTENWQASTRNALPTLPPSLSPARLL